MFGIWHKNHEDQLFGLWHRNRANVRLGQWLFGVDDVDDIETK